MPVQHERTPDYWVGNLAMTLALASKAPDPQPVMKATLRDFLRDHPPGHGLGDMLRDELKGKR